MKTGLLFFFIIFFFLNADEKYPRTAIGSLPTPTPGNIFSGPNDIGNHNFSSNQGEGNGIVFTCGAGHIDLAHVRATADWTRYAYKIIYNELTDSKSYILFKTSVDPSIFHIDIKYPENWDSLTKETKKNKIHLAAKGLAKYLIFNAANWHEILTWYGYSKIRFFSEYPSSFSWEDVFSNIMGIHLVDKVLDLKDEDYNLAMTNAIKLEMEDLKMLDRYESIAATSRVKDLWYKGWVPGLLKMKFRNFDIGYSDGHINPVIVPNNHLCLEQPHPGYKVPTLINANLYGIFFKLEIEPKEHTSKKILRIIYEDNYKNYTTINPENHIPVILKHIKRQALKKGYKYTE